MAEVCGLWKRLESWKLMLKLGVYRGQRLRHAGQTGKVPVFWSSDSDLFGWIRSSVVSLDIRQSKVIHKSGVR